MLLYGGRWMRQQQARLERRGRLQLGQQQEEEEEQQQQQQHRQAPVLGVIGERCFQEICGPGMLIKAWPPSSTPCSVLHILLHPPPSPPPSPHHHHRHQQQQQQRQQTRTLSTSLHASSTPGPKPLSPSLQLLRTRGAEGGHLLLLLRHRALCLPC